MGNYSVDGYFFFGTFGLFDFFLECADCDFDKFSDKIFLFENGLIFDKMLKMFLNPFL